MLKFEDHESMYFAYAHSQLCISLHAVIGRGKDFYFSNESKSSVGVVVPHQQSAWKSGRQDVSVEGATTWISRPLWTLFLLSINTASSARIIIQPWFGWRWVEWATCSPGVLKTSCSVFHCMFRVTGKEEVLESLLAHKFQFVHLKQWPAEMTSSTWKWATFWNK